jgi:cellulose synthase/poly-beta-1,6-N-acetylglucosamine synthase-like glycosyltransferase
MLVTFLNTNLQIGLIVASSVLLLILVVVFIVIGLTRYPRYKRSDDYKSYAFLIPAKNEEKVIGNIIKSIRAMNYPQDKVRIFVISNNSTDKTASISKSLGVEVVEVNDPEIDRVGKALQYFFKYIKETYGTYEICDAYIRMDADNTFDKDYLININSAYVATGGVITSYRANYNLDYNIRSSLTGTLMMEAMMAFKLLSTYRISPIVTGPGVLFSSKIITEMNGWNLVSISEDVEFTAYLTSHKHRLYFASDAVFYDEQPTTYKVIFRQRLRWQKGHFQVFTKYIGKLFLSIFSSNFLSSLVLFIGLIPFGLITVLSTLGFGGYSLYLSITTGDFMILFYMVGLPNFIAIMFSYIIVIIAFISERKFSNIKWYKKIVYILFSPISLFITTVQDFMQLFIPVKWNKIDHVGKRNKKDL